MPGRADECRVLLIGFKGFCGADSGVIIAHGK
jgi:hypothetical protein